MRGFSALIPAQKDWIPGHARNDDHSKGTYGTLRRQLGSKGAVSIGECRGRERRQRRRRRGSGNRLDFFSQPIADQFLLYFQIIVGLEVEPQPARGAKIAAETQGRTGTDRALAMHDFIDPAGGQRSCLSPACAGRYASARGTLPVGFHRDVWARSLFSPLCCTSTVIIRYRDIVRIAIAPDKADAPLVIDSDASSCFSRIFL